MRLSFKISLAILVLLSGLLQAEMICKPGPDSNGTYQYLNPGLDGKVGTANPFMLMINSPRANAMGGCTITWVDEQSGMHNPGGLGLLHLNRVLSLALPTSTDWFPDITDGLQLKTYSFGAGVSRHLLWGGDKRPDIAVGLSYSNMTMEYGTFIVTDYNAEVIGMYTQTAIARYYSAGIGVDYFCRLGVGLTYATVMDQRVGTQDYDFDAKGHVINLGAILEAPLFQFLPPALNPNRSDHLLHFDLTPAVAVMFINAGKDSISYPYATSLLTQITHLGSSLTGSVGLHDADIAGVTLVTERGLYAGQTLEWRDGWELALLNIFSLRGGRSRVEPYPTSYRYSRGFGVKLDGIIDWYRHFSPHAFDHGIARYAAEHLSVSFDYAKYGINNDIPALDNTKFFKVTVSF
jgi:hypothetical protein